MADLNNELAAESSLRFLLGILSLPLLADFDAHAEARTVHERLWEEGNQEAQNRVWPVRCAPRLIANVANSSTSIGVRGWHKEGGSPD